MLGLNRPCLDCGALSPNSRCAEHEAILKQRMNRKRDENRDRLSPRERGYDAAWSRLSARARRLQPWCSQCNAREDLTTDHLPSAWARKAEGKPIRLSDVDVLCRSCNAKKGTSRPGSERAA